MCGKKTLVLRAWILLFTCVTEMFFFLLPHPLYSVSLSFHSTYNSWLAPSLVKGVNGSNKFAMTLEPLSRSMSLSKDLKTEL